MDSAPNGHAPPETPAPVPVTLEVRPSNRGGDYLASIRRQLAEKLEYEPDDAQLAAVLAQLLALAWPAYVLGGAGAATHPPPPTVRLEIELARGAVERVVTARDADGRIRTVLERPVDPPVGRA